MATPFTDECYSPELVAAVNAELDSGEDAFTIWERCTSHLRTMEGSEGFDTAPREYLLCLLEERNVPDFELFAPLFGFKNYK